MEVKSGRSEWPPEVKCPQRSSLVGQVSGQDLTEVVTGRSGLRSGPET
jgi:hypothetical protein